MFKQGHMVVVAGVREDEPSLQGQDAHPLLCLEAVVMTQLIGQGGRNILGRLIESLVPSLGAALRPRLSIELHLRPQGLVGRCNLTGDRTGHLRRDLEASTYLAIGSILQADLVTHLAMLESNSD